MVKIMTNQNTDEIIKALNLSTKAKEILRKLVKRTRQSNLGTCYVNEDELSSNKKEFAELQKAKLIEQKENTIIITIEGVAKGL